MKGKLYIRLIIAVAFFDLIIAAPVLSQTQNELKDMFLEAESYFLFEEYSDALPIYQKILRAEPENYNIIYRIGICYLNDPYQLEKSINYLEKAVNNISNNYRENSFKEMQAPPEALYYLGNAYRVNNRLHEAIATYKKFKEILDPEIYDTQLVEKQIQSCEIALRLEAKPNYLVKQDLGDTVNSRFAEINPLVSGDESTLVFTKKLQFYDAVFYSKKVDGRWSAPVNLTPFFALDGNSYCTGISWDGKELFVYRSDGFDGNIYYSYQTGNDWSKLEKLNDNINTKYWESHASLSPDGKILYFTSNRKGGYGGLDIYQSKRTGRTDWEKPVNLGPVINSAYNEETPFLTGNGKTLYFSSQGHYNMGGYDIFYATLLSNGKWSAPVNAGYPLNTTADDLFFVPVKDGEFAYYSMFNPDEGYGLDDIYRLEIYSDLHPRKFILKGLTSKETGLDVDLSKLHVKLINKKDNITFSETEIHPDGSFSMDAESGNFELVISGKGIEESKTPVNIPVAYPSDEYPFESKVTAPAETAVADTYKRIEPVRQIPLMETEITSFEVITDKAIPIRLNLEKNSMLDLKILVDDSLLKEETFKINRRRFVYFYTPKEGLNSLKFALTDKDGNTVTKDITIRYIPESKEIISEPLAQTTEYNEKDFMHLSSLGSTNLSKYLEELNYEKYNIASASDLYDHLIEEMAGNNYSLAEIDELFISYLSQKSLDNFMNELEKGSAEKIRGFIHASDLDSANVYFSENLVDYLGSFDEDRPYSEDEFYYALTSVASKSTGDIKGYLRLLEKNSNQNMSYVLRRLESNSGSFSEPFQVTKYFLTNIGEDNYSADDLKNMMKESAINFDVDFLQQSMMFNSQGILKQAVTNLNLFRDNIGTSRELLQYLWIKAPEYGYAVNDVINLVENIRDNHERNLELFRQHLAKHASGNLKAVIQQIDLVQKNISTFADLLNYLINNSKFQNYNRETVYKLLLDIIYIENTDDFAANMKKHAGPGIIQALDSINIHHFSSPYELVQYLVGYTEKYAFTEQDLLNVLLKMVLEKDFGLEKVKVRESGRYMIQHPGLITFLIAGNGILLILILIFFIRRKKKRSNST